jgi:hypothetical protein
MLNGWAGTYRHVILALMPVEQIALHYDPVMGRPTKELYSMAGLILIKEFKNWTAEETVDAYCYNTQVQYALNLEPSGQELGIRTLERYIKLFEDDQLAQTTMETITAELINRLELDITRQRLDSTHVLSDMASFGRTRLMGVAVKRFLTQLKRHDIEAYNSLGQDFTDRYTPSNNNLFCGVSRDSQSRQKLRQDVAEDMYLLIRQFSDTAHGNRSTFTHLEQVFYQQCEVSELKVVVKPSTGGNVIQNHSDPDATYDGHKGAGYKVQISETCSPANEVQLITYALAQTACESDTNELEPALEALEENGNLPRIMVADTLYCCDENVQKAEIRQVELIGPSPSDKSTLEADRCEKLNIDDFDIDEDTEEVITCPGGHKPLSSERGRKSGVTTTIMPGQSCGDCDFFDQCPVKKQGNKYCLRHTAKMRRNAARRREEQTDAFREQYKIRAGIEATNSGLKRKTGMGRLRVRGRPAVFHAIYLKITGWNILRAAGCAKIRKIVMEGAISASYTSFLSLTKIIIALKHALNCIFRQIQPQISKFTQPA